MRSNHAFAARFCLVAAHAIRLSGLAISVLPPLVLIPIAAHADEDNVSPERARAARAAGLIAPLANLLKAVEQRYVGLVIEAELHETGGRWLYEFDMLPEDGQMYRVLMDAKSGAIIGTRGPMREKP